MSTEIRAATDMEPAEANALVGISSYYTGLRGVVTGGPGFIGSNIAKRLVDLGAEVQVVD